MTDLNDRLDAAIDGMLAGQDLPEDPELRELLAPAQMLMRTPVPAPTQHTARVRMNAALDARRSRKGLLGLGWLASLSWPRPKQWVPAMTAAIIAFLFFLSSFALPGQLLYPLKQSTEAFGLLLARTPQAQADYYAHLADRRLSEMERLVATGRVVPSGTLNQFKQDWEEALSVPGVERNTLRDQALEQAERLQILIPQLPADLQDEARSILDGLLQQFQLNLPSLPTPTPAPSALTPSPTLTPTPTSTLTAPPNGIPPAAASGTPNATQPAPTPSAESGPLPLPSSITPGPTSSPASPTTTPTPNPTPNPNPTPTPTPSATTGAPSPPTATPTYTPGATHPPAPSETPHPTEPPHETETPSHTPTPTTLPTNTPASTSTPQPTSTPRPTHTPEPTHTPTHTPHPTSTPTPQPTPTRTHTPHPTETSEPTETPHETETPEPTETPKPTKTPDHDDSLRL